jgi:hypothetical protein
VEGVSEAIVHALRKQASELNQDPSRILHRHGDAGTPSQVQRETNAFVQKGGPSVMVGTLDSFKGVNLVTPESGPLKVLVAQPFPNFAGHRSALALGMNPNWTSKTPLEVETLVVSYDEQPGAGLLASGPYSPYRSPDLTALLSAAYTMELMDSVLGIGLAKARLEMKG